MADRPKFFDDLAGVAGGAFSALAGMREEVESTIRARVDEAIRKLDLVKREDLEAVQEMAAAARTGQEALDKRLAGLELEVMRSRLMALEAQVASLKAATPASSPSQPSTAEADAMSAFAPHTGTGAGLGAGTGSGSGPGAPGTGLSPDPLA